MRSKMISAAMFSIWAALLLSAMGCGTKMHRCPTEGMLPTLYADDVFRAELHPYRDRELARGDIVVCALASSAGSAEGKLFVKRAIGLPGEQIEIREFRVYINGQELSEPYALIPEGKAGAAPAAELRDMQRQQIPAGHCFILGDNRGNSYDSRHFGPVSVASIVARAIVVVKSSHNGQAGKDLTCREVGG